MSLLLLLAGAGPGVPVVPEQQSAPGGSGRPIHVGDYEVFGYSERHDRDDDEAIAAVLTLL